VCAATRTEANACRDGIRLAGLAGEFEILETGIGGTYATEALSNRIKHGACPRMIVSSGFAGTWSDQVEVGAWVSAGSSLWLEEKDGFSSITPSLIHLPKVDLPLLPTHWVTLRRLGVSRPSDFFLGPTEIVTVDMESAALARVAVAHMIPFLALRLVTDTPSQKLPDFLKYFTSGWAGEGRKHHWRGTLALLRRPKEAWEFVQAARTWVTLLAEGWKDLAPAVRGSCGSAPL
jgi:hypothetical protein